MAYSKTSIISLAVMLLGHRPIQTLDDADDLVIAAEQMFDVKLPSVLAAGNWRFATQLQQLSLSPIIPPTETLWNQVYYLPSGYLKTIRVIPNNYVWEIYTDGLIYCNWGTSTAIYMEYIFQPDIHLIPGYFIDYFIYEIGAALALTNAQKPEYYAQLEQKRVHMQAMANAIDAQNRPQYSQVDIPMLNKRNITGVIGPQIG
jgi:hypothetical protein